jgi:hypothetical protein
MLILSLQGICLFVMSGMEGWGKIGNTTIVFKLRAEAKLFSNKKRIEKKRDLENDSNQMFPSPCTLSHQVWCAVGAINNSRQKSIADTSIYHHIY